MIKFAQFYGINCIMIGYIVVITKTTFIVRNGWTRSMNQIYKLYCLPISHQSSPICTKDPPFWTLSCVVKIPWGCINHLHLIVAITYFGITSHGNFSVFRPCTVLHLKGMRMLGKEGHFLSTNYKNINMNISYRKLEREVSLLSN